MNSKDFIVRYVPGYGYLAIVEVNGIEKYRSGKYYDRATDAFTQAFTQSLEEIEAGGTGKGLHTGAKISMRFSSLDDTHCILRNDGTEAEPLYWFENLESGRNFDADPESGAPSNQRYHSLTDVIKEIAKDTKQGYPWYFTETGKRII